MRKFAAVFFVSVFLLLLVSQYLESPHSVIVHAHELEALSDGENGSGDVGDVGTCRCKDGSCIAGNMYVSFRPRCLYIVEDSLHIRSCAEGSINCVP